MGQNRNESPFKRRKKSAFPGLLVASTKFLYYTLKKERVRREKRVRRENEMKATHLQRSLLFRAALVAVFVALGLGSAAMAQGRLRIGRGEDLLWRLPLEQKLSRPVDIQLEDAALEDVVDFLRATLELNIVVSPEVWLHEQPLITLKLEGLDGERILNWTMTQTGLRYIFHQGAVLITTPDHARKVETRYFKIYDVRDLAASPVRAQRGARGDDAAGAVPVQQVYGREQDQDRRRGGGQDIVALIVMLTGPENWRQVTVLGGDRQEEDGRFWGPDDF